MTTTTALPAVDPGVEGSRRVSVTFRDAEIGVPDDNVCTDACCAGDTNNSSSNNRRNRLANANFFLPAGLSPITDSMRGFRKSLRKSLRKSFRRSSTAAASPASTMVSANDEAIDEESGLGKPDAHPGGEGGAPSRSNSKFFFLPTGIRQSFCMVIDAAGSSTRSGDDASSSRRRRSSAILRQSIADASGALSTTASKVFESESSRSSLVRRPVVVQNPAIPRAPTPRVGTSKITATGICCASEIPAVRSLLVPQTGVTRVRVTPTTKTISVDHDIDVVSAHELCRLLNDDGFGASLVRDAALEVARKEGEGSGIPTEVVVTSVFEVSWQDDDDPDNGDVDSSHESEAEALQSGEEAIQRFLASNFAVDHIKAASFTAARDDDEPGSMDASPAKSNNDADSSNPGSSWFSRMARSSLSSSLTRSMRSLKNTKSTRSLKNTKPKTVRHDGAVVETAPSNSNKSNAGVSSWPGSSSFSMGMDSSKTTTGSGVPSAAGRKTRCIYVEHNPYYVTASQIAKSLNENCHRISKGSATVQSDGGEDGLWALSRMKPSDDAQRENRAGFQTTSPLRVACVIASGLLWIVSMLSHVGGPPWEYLQYVALPSIALGLYPIARKAFRTLRRKKFDVNCMILFAVVGAVALQDFTEAAAVTFLFSISEWLEALTTSRARKALATIISLRPEQARLINRLTQEVIVVPASVVAVGSVVRVRTGDKVPCDGIVIEGASAVDESNLTGESRPVPKLPDAEVSGGTINVGNEPLMVRTTSTTNDSAVAKLIRLVEEAQSNRSDTEAFIDKFAQIYTPIVVVTALCMCTFPWIVSREVGREWFYNGLVVIVIACPCALIISTPVTYVAGLAAAAQKGVIIKGGQYLESLARTRSIFLDKTGTLSQGVFQLLHVNVIGQSRDRKDVLAYLSLMEASSSHPLANAIVEAAENEQVYIPNHWVVKDHTLLQGEGISGTIEGKMVHVGNKRLFDRMGLTKDLSKEDAEAVDDWAKVGGTIGFISIEGEGIVGSYCVSDKVRPEAKEVIKQLKRKNIELSMLTGDQRRAAIGLAETIGLDEGNVKSDLLPREKLSAIQEKVEAYKEQQKWWQTKRAVMMVGDGVNDAPALALADISVAMGEGAALAMETSDVTLMASDLNKLLYIINMGPRVVRIIIQNIVFSFAVKALVMGFTFAGRASLWAAIGSDVGAMLLVTLNGMRLLPSRQKVKDNVID